MAELQGEELKLETTFEGPAMIFATSGDSIRGGGRGKGGRGGKR